MAIIQTSGAQRKLQAQYGLLAGPPAPTISEEIVPVTIVDDLSASGGPGQAGGLGIPPLLSDEFQVFQYEKSIERLGNPGLYSTCTFVNPAGSGITAMVTSFAGTAETDLTMVPLFFTSSLLAPVAADLGYLRDTRLYPVASDPFVVGLSKCGMFAAQTPTPPGTERPGLKLFSGAAGFTNSPADVRFLGYIFRPNSGVTFGATVPDRDIRINLVWSERQLLDGEPNGT